MRNRWWVIVLLLLGAVSMASSKKGTAVMLSFHLETSKEDWPKYAQAVKLGEPVQQYYFKLSPLVTDSEIKWFSPFISEDGVTYGCAFKLSQHGTNLLQTATSAPENHGKLMASNMQPLDADGSSIRSYVQIDRRIDDGILVVWEGFSDAHLRVFAQRFPHVRDVPTQ